MMRAGDFSCIRVNRDSSGTLRHSDKYFTQTPSNFSTTVANTIMYLNMLSEYFAKADR